jgi:hypothetical protein
MNIDKKISVLRTFFNVTNLSFNFAENLKKSFGLELNECENYIEMKKLHKTALEELEKKEPCLDAIDDLLSKMESLSKKQIKPNFKKGGITQKK